MDRTDLPKTPRVRGLLRWLVERDGRGGRRARQIDTQDTDPTHLVLLLRPRPKELAGPRSPLFV